MSHVSTITTEIDSGPAVKAAALSLKCKVEEGVMADLGYSNRVNGDIVFTLPDGRTQVALCWDAKKKKYIIKCDHYSGAVERHFGKDFSKLRQMFSLKKVEIAARKQGYKATKAVTNVKDGSVQLYLY